MFKIYKDLQTYNFRNMIQTSNLIHIIRCSTQSKILWPEHESLLYKGQKSQFSYESVIIEYLSSKSKARSITKASASIMEHCSTAKKKEITVFIKPL